MSVLMNNLQLVVAASSHEEVVYNLYKRSIESVNKGPVRLGWNINKYPDISFIRSSIANKEMLLCQHNDSIKGAAVINYNVNPEYDDIDWSIKAPKDKISTIHALTIDPDFWGQGYAVSFLELLINYCRQRGDIANHLDVIDTNTFAERLYLKCGFNKVCEIQMYYEVVGTRSFSMMEYVF